MARRPRLRIAGVPQHVIQRGNNRQATFSPENQRFYLACLQRAARRHDCAIHAYVLMTNHVHLLVTPRRPEAISLVMRDVGRRYVQYINYTYRRSGALWEGRFKSILVDAQRYFFTCCRYIELNPVRAGIVTRPEEYRWSSHCHYALGREDHLVTAHEEYQALGNDGTARRQAYRELFSGHLDEKVLTEIHGAVDRSRRMGASEM